MLGHLAGHGGLKVPVFGAQQARSGSQASLICLRPRHRFNEKFYRQTRFTSFPNVPIVHAKKFQLMNWVPSTKPDTYQSHPNPGPMGPSPHFLTHFLSLYLPDIPACRRILYPASFIAGYA